MKIQIIITLFASYSLTLLPSCQQNVPPVPTAPTWLNMVDQEVQKLGSFNWIIVAEPSFPALSRSGITTITTPVSTMEALHGVLQSLDSHSHVKSHIHLTREAEALNEQETPGTDEYRAILKKVINGRETQVLTNNALNLLITDARKNYRILVIKTTTSLPYSSVFLELESGYWDGESETALRKRMSRLSN